MNLVDRSGWLEYFFEGPNSAYFGKPILETDLLLVPTICIYEVSKKVALVAGEKMAVGLAAQMKRGIVIELSAAIAIEASFQSIQRKLAMADSIIYTTALSENATIWTQDEHFRDLPNVKFIAPKK